MAALTGFVVTVTVLVVQMVTGTFSARCMRLRLWYRDRVLKGVLALLIAALAFSFSLLRRIETNFVPDIGVTVAGVLVVASLVLFFDRFVHLLRPVRSKSRDSTPPSPGASPVRSTATGRASLTG